MRGRLADAEQSMRRGLGAVGATYQYRVDQAVDLAWLALLCALTGRLDEADEISRRAAEAVAGQAGIDHPQQVHFIRALVLRARGDQRGAEASLAAAAAALQQALAPLEAPADRERYCQAYAFNRHIEAARRGRWPDPPRLW